MPAPVLFVVSGGALIAILSYAATLHRRVREREERLALLNGELKHRIKNLFALTTSVSLQTLRTSASLSQAAGAIVGRIQAIAAAQELATETGDDIDLRTLAAQVVAPMSPSAERLVMEGPDHSLSGADATSFSLLLHELATNAIKYGAWSGASGQVRLVWTSDASAMKLEWTETGPDIAESAASTHEGFGAVLLRRAFPHASVRHEVTRKGAFCSITLPR